MSNRKHTRTQARAVPVGLRRVIFGLLYGLALGAGLMMGSGDGRYLGFGLCVGVTMSVGMVLVNP